MKKFLPPLICLLVIAIPSSAQRVGKDESYDQQWNLQERERQARKDEPSGCDSMIYPGLSMYSGKGFSGGLAKVSLNNRCGFIDRAGNLVIKLRFDDAGRFSEGLAPVEIGGRWGYINNKGKIVIPVRFDWALGFYEGRALIKIKDKWGYVDPTGAVVIAPEFDEAGSFSEGLARVCVYEKDYPWGFIDRVGKYRWGFINKSGQWVLKPVYDGPVDDFDNGRALVGKDIGYENGVIVETFYVDKSGQSYPKTTTNDPFEPFGDLRPYSEGMAAFRRDDKYGYMNEKGSIVVTPQFVSAGYFSEGLAPVEVDKVQSQSRSWGYINRAGKMVIEPQFDWAWKFSEGRALVAIGDRVGYVNEVGHYIWRPSK